MSFNKKSLRVRKWDTTNYPDVDDEIGDYYDDLEEEIGGRNTETKKTKFKDKNIAKSGGKKW